MEVQDKNKRTIITYPVDRQWWEQPTQTTPHIYGMFYQKTYLRALHSLLLNKEELKTTEKQYIQNHSPTKETRYCAITTAEAYITSKTQKIVHSKNTSIITVLQNKQSITSKITTKLTTTITKTATTTKTHV